MMKSPQENSAVSMPWLTRIPRYFLIVAFLALVLTPRLDLLLDIDPTPPLREGRRTHRAPKWEWTEDRIREYPSLYERHDRDTFGFRDFLVRSHTAFQVLGLKVSPSGIHGVPFDKQPMSLQELTRPNVLLGKQGWMFFTGKCNQILADYRGLLPFPEEELIAFEIALAERRDYLAERGIDYLFFVAPDKQSIYPEMMPDSVRVIRKETRWDQLIERLKVADIPFVDLRAPLIRAKESERIYEITGTHWNELGAHVAYSAVMEQLSKGREELAPLPLSLFSKVETLRPGIDLAGLLSLNRAFSEVEITLAPKRSRLAKRREDVFDLGVNFAPHAVPFALENRSSIGPRAMVFRDSFTTRLAPFFGEHFSRSAYYWMRQGSGSMPLTVEMLDFEKPDVFLDEWVERDLITTLPNNGPHVRAKGSQRRFERLGRVIKGVEYSPTEGGGKRCDLSSLKDRMGVVFRIEARGALGRSLIFERESTRKVRETIFPETRLTAIIQEDPEVFYIEAPEARRGDLWKATYEEVDPQATEPVNMQARAVKRMYLQ